MTEQEIRQQEIKQAHLILGALCGGGGIRQFLRPERVHHISASGNTIQSESVNWCACPTAMKEQVRFLVVDEPLVFHLLRNKTIPQAGKLLAVKRGLIWK